MLRFESPLQIGNRRTRESVVLGGVNVPAGTFLHLLIAAANRDEREFSMPEDFDIGRTPNKHLAFAHGIHTCAGNAVARIEATVAFTKLIQRFPNFCRNGPTERAPRLRFRVVERLPIVLGASSTHA